MKKDEKSILSKFREAEFLGRSEASGLKTYKPMIGSTLGDVPSFARAGTADHYKP